MRDRCDRAPGAATEYEWRKTESGKQPYYITLKESDDDEVVFFAGLWEPLREGAETCCAIMTEPVSLRPSRSSTIASRWCWTPSADGSGSIRNCRTGRRSARLPGGCTRTG